MIFTFYSFKGGVGRSMAMAAVGYLFARRGLKVLAIDFDLEAPGLERYFFESEQAAKVREHSGFMDLVQAYKLALSSETEFDSPRFKAWWDFVYEAIPSLAGGGCVDLMTSGRREPGSALRDYAYVVRSFDWQDFFDNWKGERFFDWLRRQVTEGERAYDVVLIDSRTGVTEMGGICAYQLADVAVMLCAPNLQNIDGTWDVANDFRSDPVLALRRGRPLELVVIPARIEENNPRREEFFAKFEQRFGSDFMPAALAMAGLDYRNLALPYEPLIAVIERLVGEEDTAERTRQVFQRLAHALTLLANRDGPLRDLRADALAELRGEASETVVAQIAEPTRSSAGFDAFLDFAGRDHAMVTALAANLEAAGLRVWFGARDPDAGPDWKGTDARAFDESAWLVVLIGQEDHPSKYRRNLIDQALRRGRPRILPVMLDDPPAWNLLADYGLAQIRALVLGQRPVSESELGELISVLKRTEAPKPKKAVTALEQPVDPYPGDAAFGEDNASFFFGRDHEIPEVLSALARSNVVLLSGPAGVGKTSLAMAGVAKRVREIDDLEGNGTWSVERVDFADPDAIERLGQASKAEGSSGPARLWILDSLDSFEQPGSFAGRERRFAFVTDLMRTAGPRRKFLLVWREILDQGEINDVLARWGNAEIGFFSLAPLDPAALYEAVEKPAERLGHLLEPGLAQRLVESAGGGYAAVAQIQRVLPALWKERRRGWLTNKALEQVGGVSGGLRQSLDSLRSAFGPDDANALRILLRHLVELDTGLQLRATWSAWSELASLPALAPDPVALRDRIAGRYLIDLWHAGPIRNDPGGAWCALALPAAEPYGAEELRSDPEFLLWRRRFAELVAVWQASGRGDDDLLTGLALAEAERMAIDHDMQMTARQREFIDASRRVRAKREKEAARLRHEKETAELKLNAQIEKIIKKVHWIALAAFAVIFIIWQNVERRVDTWESQKSLLVQNVPIDVKKARSLTLRTEAQKVVDVLGITVSVAYPASVLSALVFGLIVHLRRARRNVLHLFARMIRTGGHLEESPGVFLHRRTPGPWWLAPLPTKDGQEVTAQQLQSWLGWHCSRRRNTLLTALASATLIFMVLRFTFLGLTTEGLLRTAGNLGRIIWPLLLISCAALVFFQVYLWWTDCEVRDSQGSRQISVSRRDFVAAILTICAAAVPAPIYFRLRRNPRYRAKKPRRSSAELTLTIGSFRWNSKSQVFHGVLPNKPATRRITAVRAVVHCLPLQPESMETVHTGDIPLEIAIGRRLEDDRRGEPHVQFARAACAFEQAALLRIVANDVEGACQLLLGGVRHDLRYSKQWSSGRGATRKPSIHIYDLLAGLCVRHTLPQHMTTLKKLIVEGDGGASSFAQRQLVWDNYESKWYKRWADKSKPLKWAGIPM